MFSNLLFGSGSVYLAGVLVRSGVDPSFQIRDLLSLAGTQRTMLIGVVAFFGITISNAKVMNIINQGQASLRNKIIVGILLIVPYLTITGLGFYSCRTLSK
jgi:hypothetical protein